MLFSSALTRARCSDENARHVVIKRAPPHLLKIQREILQMVKNHMCVRQMIDIIESDSSLVLEYLDNNLLDVCNRKRLESSEVKFVARTILEALAVLHEKGFVHTGQ
jgi:casein kinase II subunit alpha